MVTDILDYVSFLVNGVPPQFRALLLLIRFAGINAGLQPRELLTLRVSGWFGRALGKFCCIRELRSFASGLTVLKEQRSNNGIERDQFRAAPIPGSVTSVPALFGG